MNMVIDIGNTHTKLAWFEKGKLIEVIRYEEFRISAIRETIEKIPARQVIISSVGLPDSKIKPLLESEHRKILVLDYTTPLPLEISYDTPETLGHDRIAAAVGAYYLYPNRNVLIVDMGTAITIDFITAEGKFPGGNISPGLHTRFRALNEYTAKLPLVGMDPAFPPFGYNTTSAIIAGVQEGIVFEINGYINAFEHRYPDCEFILTGGDAGFFVSKLKKPIFALPELVLTGLNHILEFNALGKC
jgi:type III pantothenate kinase